MRTPRLLALVASLLCAAVLSAAAVPSVAGAAPAPGSAVVFVSGFTTTTPFTSSSSVCAGREGPTWGDPTGAPALLRSAGYAVFTAPVGNHGRGAPPCAAPGEAVPPASATIDSNGDVDANGLALLELLAFLRTSYGVTNVQLVGHSDGGLWSRSAITQQPASDAALPTVQSLTTLGTPHTGSFGADLAEYVHNGACDTTGILQEICQLMLPELQALVEDLGEVAVDELTSSFLAGWNGRQSIGCPVTVVAGTYVSLPSWIGWAVPSYYAPNDGIVGEASGLNQSSTSVSFARIPAAPFQTVTGGAFPVVHSETLSSLLGTPNTLTNDAAIAAVVQGSIATPPGTAPCAAATDPAAAPQTGAATAGGAAGGGAPVAAAATSATTAQRSGGTVRAQFSAPLAPDARGRFASRARDVALLHGRARLRCGGRTLDGVPLLGSERLRFTVLPRCRGGVVVRGGRALIVRDDRSGRALHVSADGTTVRASVRGRGLRAVQIEARVGRRWRDVPRSGRLTVQPAQAGERVPVRATGVDSQGRRLVATAQLAR